MPERISPAIIFLRPPEKLVLEMSARGGYNSIVWSRDNAVLGTSAAPAPLSEFTNFFEIFVREPTTTSDLGIYDVVYSGEGGLGTIITVITEGTCICLTYLLIRTINSSLLLYLIHLELVRLKTIILVAVSK